MDEEVSWHFRGPLLLKQFAYYTPGSNSSKRDTASPLKGRYHGHGAFHKHEKAIRDMQDQYLQARQEWITATINGDVVSWPNPSQAAATSSSAEAQAGGEWIYATVGGQTWSWQQGAQDATQTSSLPETTSTAGSTTASTPEVSIDAGPGNWGRQAYYDADAQTADGLVFLNHMGGQGSGTFDYTWGNSLSYASSDAQTGSATREILADQTLPDNTEIVIMSDKQCDGDCGTVRPNTVAYHGFEGDQKLFLFEFSMPLTNTTGFNMDMPAIWALNAQIPNTIQYGPADCSCWDSGCGELDVVEVLDSGNTRAKSTYHGNPSGGDSNYFDRPTDATVRMAVIFDGAGNAVHIVTLPDGTPFDDAIANVDVAGWLAQVQASTSLAAVFELSGS